MTQSYIQVRKVDKTAALDFIHTWIKKQFNVLVKWDEATQYNTSTYHLDQKSRTLATQLSAIAHASDQRSNRKPPPSATTPKQAPNHPMVRLVRSHKGKRSGISFSLKIQVCAAGRQSNSHHYDRVNYA